MESLIQIVSNADTNDVEKKQALKEAANVNLEDVMTVLLELLQEKISRNTQEDHPSTTDENEHNRPPNVNFEDRMEVVGEEEEIPSNPNNVGFKMLAREDTDSVSDSSDLVHNERNSQKKKTKKHKKKTKKTKKHKKNKKHKKQKNIDDTPASNLRTRPEPTKKRPLSQEIDFEEENPITKKRKTIEEHASSHPLAPTKTERRIAQENAITAIPLPERQNIKILEEKIKEKEILNVNPLEKRLSAGQEILEKDIRSEKGLTFEMFDRSDIEKVSSREAANQLKTFSTLLSPMCPMFAPFMFVFQEKTVLSLVNFAESVVQLISIEQHFQQVFSTPSKAKSGATAIKSSVGKLLTIALLTHQYMQILESDKDTTFKEVFKTTKTTSQTDRRNAFLSWIFAKYPVLFLIFANHVLRRGLSAVAHFWNGESYTGGSIGNEAPFFNSMIYCIYAWELAVFRPEDKEVAMFFFSNNRYLTKKELKKNKIEKAKQSELILNYMSSPITEHWGKEYLIRARGATGIEISFVKKVQNFLNGIDRNRLDPANIPPPIPVSGINLHTLIKYDYTWNFWYTANCEIKDLYSKALKIVNKVSNPKLQFTEMAKGDNNIFSDEALESFRLQLNKWMQDDQDFMFCKDEYKISEIGELLILDCTQDFSDAFVQLILLEMHLRGRDAPQPSTLRGKFVDFTNPFGEYKFIQLGLLPVCFLCYQCFLFTLGISRENMMADFISGEFRMGVDSEIRPHVEIAGDSGNFHLAGKNKMWNFTPSKYTKEIFELAENKVDYFMGCLSDIEGICDGKKITELFSSYAEQKQLELNEVRVPIYQKKGELFLIDEFAIHSAKTQYFNACLTFNFKRISQIHHHGSLLPFPTNVTGEYFYEVPSFEVALKRAPRMDPENLFGIQLLMENILNSLDTSFGFKLFWLQRELGEHDQIECPTIASSVSGLSVVSIPQSKASKRPARIICEHCNQVPVLIHAFCECCNKFWCIKHAGSHTPEDPSKKILFLGCSTKVKEFIKGEVDYLIQEQFKRFN